MAEFDYCAEHFYLFYLSKNNFLTFLLRMRDSKALCFFELPFLAIFHVGFFFFFFFFLVAYPCAVQYTKAQTQIF